MADAPDIERELTRALAAGRLTTQLPILLRRERVAATARGDKPAQWGWGFLYDVVLWNRDMPIEQLGTFVRGTRDWMADPTRDMLWKVRTAFVMDKINVNGRGAGGADFAQIVVDVAARMGAEDE